MKSIDGLLDEMNREAKTTRRVLEAIPGDKLAWKPHERSWSLGDLGSHIATIPGVVAQEALVEAFDLSRVTRQSFASRTEILTAFEESMAHAREILAPQDDDWMMSTWTLVVAGKPVLRIPRGRFLRAVLLNHSYHHRGQLTVYLRLLDVPVPAIYGPSADEGPFSRR